MLSQTITALKNVWRIFKSLNKKKAVECIIQCLKQIKLALDYAACFQKYSSHTEWNNASLIVIFQRGLKNHIKEKLMWYEEKIDNLKTLMTVAIEINDKWYKLQQDKQFNKWLNEKAELRIENHNN